jgi:hypothetical protein
MNDEERAKLEALAWPTKRDRRKAVLLVGKREAILAAALADERKTALERAALLAERVGDVDLAANIRALFDAM